MTTFTVATNEYRGGGNNERTEYHPCVAWDRLAEICGQFLSKGQLVDIEGRLQTRQWDDDAGKRRWAPPSLLRKAIVLQIMAVRRSQLVGALSILLACTGCNNDPNPGMVDIARSLAPPETTITEVGENTGSRIIVGDYHASVDMDDGGLGADGLLAAITAHADAEGWMLTHTEELPGGPRLTYTRDGLQATITVFARSPTVQATIILRDG